MNSCWATQRQWTQREVHQQQALQAPPGLSLRLCCDVEVMSLLFKQVFYLNSFRQIKGGGGGWGQSTVLSESFHS